MPSHNSSYESYKYQLLDNTKSKRLESWDRVYTVHYLVDDNTDTKNLNNAADFYLSNFSKSLNPFSLA